MSTSQSLRELLSNVNHAALFKTLWQQGPVTRGHLSDASGLAVPTVFRIIGELIEAGIVESVSEIESTGGRRPTLVDLVPSAGHLIGIDVGGTKIAGMLLDLKANSLAVRLLPTGKSDRATLAQTIVGLVSDLMADAGVDRHRVLGVGIALPGSVDHKTQTLIDASNLGITDWAIAGELADALQLPVLVENDGNAAALGEFSFGAYDACPHLVFVNVGTGVGSGFIFHEQIFHGDLGLAGEIGHVTISTSGPPCSCGKQGCLEAIAGGWSIARQYEIRTNKTGITAEDVYQLANAGDRIASDILSQASDALGIALANVVNTLGISRIVLGGGMIDSHPTFFRHVQTKALERLIPEYEGRVTISPSILREKAGMMGAAALVLHSLWQGDGVRQLVARHMQSLRPSS